MCAKRSHLCKTLTDKYFWYFFLFFKNYFVYFVLGNKVEASYA